MSERLQIAYIAAAHGIRGQVKLRALLEDAASLPSLAPLTDEKGAPVPLTLHSLQGDGWIASIEGISDRNAAEAWKGKKLYSASLPAPAEGEVYLSGLIGLDVRDAAGAPLGHVIAAHDFGAGDILEIRWANGKEEMFPLQKAIFDVQKNYIVFTPPAYL